MALQSSTSTAPLTTHIAKQPSSSSTSCRPRTASSRAISTPNTPSGSQRPSSPGTRVTTSQNGPQLTDWPTSASPESRRTPAGTYWTSSSRISPSQQPELQTHYTRGQTTRAYSQQYP